MAKKKSDRDYLKKLRELVLYHQQKYHQEDQPEISDSAYDSLAHELVKLEAKLEGKRSLVSLSVAPPVTEAFTKVKHYARQWSFDNVFDLDELQAWEKRLKRVLEKKDQKTADLSYVAEHKIDGLKLVLHYKKGKLFRALTRGDGKVGEDVTHTALTIKSILPKLKNEVDLVCIGEAWLGLKEFIALNKSQQKNDLPTFANPRNAAAGSLRQLNPEVARTRNLSYFAYDVDLFSPLKSGLPVPKTQYEELSLLKTLGLPTNPYSKRCSNIKLAQAYYEEWCTRSDTLPYGVDGVVIKLDQIVLQIASGYTTKAPRFGIAYKFPAVETTTRVEAIELQVGRTGVITPVAHLSPVLIDGSTVTRATLHNEDQIRRLDVRIGDIIVLRKAGDVIPEVVSVIKELRPQKTKAYTFPKTVALCGSDGKITRISGTAAYRCVSMDSDFIRRQQLYYFVSKAAFNIEGIGPKNIDALLEQGLIKDAADLFALNTEDFLKLEGFKTKSAENAVAAIKAVRQVTLARLLVSLSIDNVGAETAELLANTFRSLAKIKQATYEELIAINGIGEIVGKNIILWQKNKVAQSFLERLIFHLDITHENTQNLNSLLSGKIFVFTGTMKILSRDEAVAKVKSLGSVVSNSVSKKTSYVVFGDSPGSKAKKAEKLGVEILSETEFMDLVAL